MLNIVFSYCYAECRYAEWDYAQCHYAECRGAFKSPSELAATSTRCFHTCVNA